MRGHPNDWGGFLFQRLFFLIFSIRMKMYLCPLNTHPAWGNPIAWAVRMWNLGKWYILIGTVILTTKCWNPPSPSFFFENQEFLRDLNLYRPAFSFNLESGLLAWFLEVKIVAYKFLGLNEKARLLFAGEGDSRERGCWIDFSPKMIQKWIFYMIIIHCNFLKKIVLQKKKLRDIPRSPV